MNNDQNNPSAESVEEEGEKVTGGNEGNDTAIKPENLPDTGTGKNVTEPLPSEETKKEEMDGYNELPDQAKVAGG